MDKETIEKFDLRQFVKSWLLPLAAEIAILLVIFNFVINITYVPTGSMIPTISEHSVLISLREYNTDELQRGEIYSFHSDELGKTLIKRLIGLPGETVRIEGNGNIYINDVRLDEPYVRTRNTAIPGLLRYRRAVTSSWGTTVPVPVMPAIGITPISKRRMSSAGRYSPSSPSPTSAS